MALVARDVVIDVPPEPRCTGRSQGGLTHGRSQSILYVRLYFVEVEEPQLASPRSDLARLLDAFEREWDLA